MGVKAKTLTGSRAVISINGKVAGIFSNVSYSVNYGLEPIYTLGNYGGQELVYTSMDTIGITVSGFRVLDNGPYVIGSVPRLQDLLNHEDITVTLVDRQSGKTTANILGVRSGGYDSNASARGLHDLTIRMTGLVLSDESDKTAQGEGTGAVPTVPYG